MCKLLLCLTVQIFLLHLKRRRLFAVDFEERHRVIGLTETVHCDYVLSSCVLCLFRQVQASNDASLLCHELFFIWSYSTSLLFIQPIIVSLCLPRVLVPFILPSKTVCRRDSLLNTCPNQFFCLCQMLFIKLLFSSTLSKTS